MKYAHIFTLLDKREKMNIVENLEEGDILIRKVKNGWIVITPNEHDSSSLDTFVYQENCESEGNFNVIHACALQELFWDHFNGYYRSKYQGGLEVNINNSGYDAMHDEEYDAMHDEEDTYKDNIHQFDISSNYEDED
jgi:hypothetical protein